MVDKSLAKLATDLPQLMLQYKLAMAQMGSQEAHEMAMLQAKMGYETSIKDEKQKLNDILTVISSEHEKIAGERKITEQNIIRLQGDIHKSKLQIEGLNVAIPKIKEEDQTVDAYKLLPEIEKMANEPRLLILNNEIELFNAKRNEEATLEAHRMELETVFSRLTGLQLIGETQVAPDLAGEKTLTQSDDFSTYFDSMLTQQIDPDTEQPYTDDVLAGNSKRFDPNDEMTGYYRKVFVESFSPSVVDQQKQFQANQRAEQQALANYSSFSAEANKMMSGLQTTQLNSIYETNVKGKLSISKGFDRKSTAYINAKTYIESMLDSPNEEMIDAQIQKAMSMSSVTQGKTFIANLKKDKSGFLRGILEAMGSGASIDEIEQQVKLADILLQPSTMSSPGFTLPTGSNPDPLDAIMQNLPD